MANTLTGLLPAMYEALNVVSREMTGFIPAVSRSSSIARAAIGQTVTVPVAPESETADTTPGVNAPDTGDQAIDNVPVAITKSKHVAVRWNGEETKGLQNAGTFSTIQAERFYQAMRALVNEIELDLFLESYRSSSRAVGTAGTTPFGTASDLSDFANTLGVLEENGTPKNDLQLVLGHAAIGNLRGKQSSLFKVNEAGSSDMLRNGMTDRIMNFAIRHSDPVTQHVAGSGLGYDLNGAGAAGDTIITLDGGTVGASGIKSGDVSTFAGDSNNYIVNTGLTSASGDIVIGGPGLRGAVADAAEMTIGGSYTPNVAFSRNAIVLATRAPAAPEGGDMADDVTTITDPLTGLSFEVAVYRQFMQVVYHVRLAWGFKAIKPAHIATLMG